MHLLKDEVTVLSPCSWSIISLCSGRSVAASAWKDSCGSVYLFVCFGGCSFNHSFIVVSFRTAGMKVNPYYRKLL